MDGLRRWGRLDAVDAAGICFGFVLSLEFHYCIRTHLFDTQSTIHLAIVHHITVPTSTSQQSNITESRIKNTHDVCPMDAAKRAEQGLETAYEISKILDTGLDKKTLEILIALCETGVNPEVCSRAENNTEDTCICIGRYMQCTLNPGACTSCQGHSRTCSCHAQPVCSAISTPSTALTAPPACQNSLTAAAVISREQLGSQKQMLTFSSPSVGRSICRSCCQKPPTLMWTFQCFRSVQACQKVNANPCFNWLTSS